MNILIIDDEDVLLFSIQRGLNRRLSEHTVFTALNFEEALPIVKSNKIDLIVSDYFLGKQNGCECIETFRQEFNFQGKTIITSGYLDLDAKKECKIDAFLNKPFSMIDFINIIQNLLDIGTPEGT